MQNSRYAWAHYFITVFGGLVFVVGGVVLMEGFNAHPRLFFIIWISLPFASMASMHRDVVAECSEELFYVSRLLMTGLAIGLSYFFVIKWEDLCYDEFNVRPNALYTMVVSCVAVILSLVISFYTYAFLTDALEEKRRIRSKAEHERYK